MKLSPETIGILKNFSTINPSVVLRAGNQIRTVSPQKTIFCVATVSEEFESQAGIYDIGRFLSTLSLFNEPDVLFGKDKFTVVGDRTELKYTYTSETMIVTPPLKDLQVPDPIVTLTVPWKSIDGAMKAAGVLQLPEIGFIGDGDSIKLCAMDRKNPTADQFNVTISDTTDSDPFKIVIRTDNIKLMPSDYEVTLSSQGIVQFKASAIQYWVASEAI